MELKELEQAVVRRIEFVRMNKEVIERGESKGMEFSVLREIHEEAYQELWKALEELYLCLAI